MKSRKKDIGSFFIRNFIKFSLLILGIFLMVDILVEKMGDRYLIEEAKKYFADTIFEENAQDMDITWIRNINGWISVLNEELNVIYSSNTQEQESYTIHQLLSLSKGEYEKDGVKYYASMKYFKDEQGEEKLGIVCVPENYIEVTMTIHNVQGSVKDLLLIYFGGFLMITIGYIGAVYGLAYRMKAKLTSSIYKLKKAFSQISEGDYKEQEDFGDILEFVEIRNSFNAMSKRLQEMEDEKKEGYVQRQRLFSDIGHDLKTPITIIQGYSSALLEGKAQGEQKEKFLKIINENAAHVEELLELLLDYTRFERSDYKMMYTSCNLGEYLRRIVIDEMLLFEESGMKLIIDIPEENVIAKVDEKVLKRAIMNLLNNALQHNKSGIQVLIRLTKDRKIIVADTGKEIKKEEEKYIFDPFVSGDDARRLEKHNNGLGLSIARKIAERHGGKLYLVKEFQNYTKAFVIELP